MRLIKIEAASSGGHAYQTIDRISKIPNGWAVIPDDMETPNLPYGDMAVEEINGIMTVTSWAPGEVPDISHRVEPTAQDDTDAMIVDHELRITMLELGV